MMSGGGGLEELRSEAERALAGLHGLVESCDADLRAAFASLGGDLDRVSVQIRESVARAQEGLKDVAEESTLVGDARQARYRFLGRARVLLDRAEEAEAGREAAEGEIAEIEAWVEELEGVQTEAMGLRARAAVVAGGAAEEGEGQAGRISGESGDDAAVAAAPPVSADSLGRGAGASVFVEGAGGAGAEDSQDVTDDVLVTALSQLLDRYSAEPHRPSPPGIGSSLPLPFPLSASAAAFSAEASEHGSPAPGAQVSGSPGGHSRSPRARSQRSPGDARGRREQVSPGGSLRAPSSLSRSIPALSPATLASFTGLAQLSQRPAELGEAAARYAEHAREQLRPLELRLRSALASALSILPLESGLQLSAGESAAVMMSKLCIYVSTVSVPPDGLRKAVFSRAVSIPERPFADVLRLANIVLGRLGVMLSRFSQQEAVLRDVIASRADASAEAVARNAPVLETLEFLEGGCVGGSTGASVSSPAGASASTREAHESSGGQSSQPPGQLFALIDEAAKLSKAYRARRFALAAWEQYLRLPSTAQEEGAATPGPCYSQLLDKMSSVSASYDEILTAKKTSDLRLLERATALESRLVNYGVAAGELGAAFSGKGFQEAREDTEALAGRLRAATASFISALTARINDCLLADDQDGAVPSFFSSGSSGARAAGEGSRIPEHISAKMNVYLSDPGKVLTEWTALGDAVLSREVFSALPALLAEILEVRRELTALTRHLGEHVSRMALPALLAGSLLPRVSWAGKLIPAPRAQVQKSWVQVPSEFRAHLSPSLAESLFAAASSLSAANAREERRLAMLRVQRARKLTDDLLGASTERLGGKRKELSVLLSREEKLTGIISGAGNSHAAPGGLDPASDNAVQAYISAKDEYLALLQRISAARNAVDEGCAAALEAISSASSSVESAISRAKDQFSSLRSRLGSEKKQAGMSLLMKWIAYCEGRIRSGPEEGGDARSVRDARGLRAPQESQEPPEGAAPAVSSTDSLAADLRQATSILDSISELRPEVTVPTLIPASERMLVEVEQLQSFVERTYPDYPGYFGYPG